MSPCVIGGMQLQEQFGFRLIMKNDVHICNIKSKFGRTTTDEERVQSALIVLKVIKGDGLEEVIRQNKGAFMTDNWDIGCTTLAVQYIKTTGGPINIKQPMHLEDKIEESIKNLFKNGNIRKCNSPWNTPMISVWKKGKQEVGLSGN